MNIPPKYEDVVAQLSAALDRESELVARSNQNKLMMDAACGENELLKQEIERLKAQSLQRLSGLAGCGIKRENIQQRLSKVEQSYDKLHAAAQRYLDFRHIGDCGQGYQFTGTHPQTELKNALNGQS